MTGYYALVIDTNQYTGNFEREMATYCTDLEFPRGGEYHNEDVEHCAWWANHTCEHYTGEYEEACAIWETPGWSNNGYGEHRQLNPDEQRKWPAYMSVAIFCDEIPPAEVWEEVWKRAQNFNEVYKLKYKWLKPEKYVTVTGIRLVRIEKTETITEMRLPV